jgi:hypothetical protein
MHADAGLSSDFLADQSRLQILACSQKGPHQMDAKPVRAEMIQSYIAQLRLSLGGVKPVDEKQLRELFSRQDYPGMVKIIRDNMNLDLRVRVGLVNEGGPMDAPAWVSAPKPMPRFGTAEFQQTLVTVFLRKSFVNRHSFEEVVIAIAHELSHIVLFGIGHPLQECEEAVDLTAMLLGYRDLYIVGCFCEVRPASIWERLNRVINAWVTGVGRRTYRTFGYLTPEEVRYAAVVLGKPLESFRTIPTTGSHFNRAALRELFTIVVGFVGVLWLASSIFTPATISLPQAKIAQKAPQPKLAQSICVGRPQPTQGIYARYDQSPTAVPLTLRTENGSNYFVKVEDAISGRPIVSFYVYGGSTLRAEIPAGSYVLKYATGNNWCGEAELFGVGALTETNKADRIFNFDDDHEYAIELIARRNGNLPTMKIGREAF